MQIFAQFYLSRARPTEFRVRVWWLDRPSSEPELIGDYGPYLVPFTPDVTARDYSFNLHNIQLQGMGLHRVELVREKPSGWNAGKWIRVVRTYFFVER